MKYVCKSNSFLLDSVEIKAFHLVPLEGRQNSFYDINIDTFDSFCDNWFSKGISSIVENAIIVQTILLLAAIEIIDI